MDWTKHEAFVEAAGEEGKSRWVGSGQPLHFGLCRAIRRVLEGRASQEGWSRRAHERVVAVRADFEWLDEAQIQPREWLGLVFFPVGICAGMILAWGAAALRTAGSENSPFLEIDDSQAVTR